MKKTILSAVVAVSLLVATGNAFAAKPAENNAGAQKYAWHLSGDVMPVPPYGLSDIPGSDTASKLIVNQPNGKVKAMVTGVMNGLHPDTTYTVYLSNPYTAYVPADLTGSYKVMYAVNGGGPNPELYDMTLTGSGGHGGYPSPGPSYGYEWDVSNIVITGNTFSFTCTYTVGAVGTIMHMSGTIATNGSLSGSWDDNYGGGRTGTWYTESGQAKPASGSTGWPSLLTGVSTFTFTTDSEGAGSWHYNFKNAVDAFSVWINGAGGTILISDSVSL
ncbi:MAG: hypothetical protein Q8K92_12125 [Leadbetterella sp.]|nr:hypothetical protein [Leadbetterella sp.]